MKSRVAKFIDSVMTAVAIWLLSAVVMRYFLDSWVVVIIAASTLTLGATFLLKSRSKNDDKIHYYAAKIGDFFLIRDQYFVLDYFLDAFKKRYNDAKIVANSGCISIKDTMIFAVFGENLSVKTMVNAFSVAAKGAAKTVVILCCGCEKNVAEARNRLSQSGIRLEIFGGDKVYLLLKSLNSLPQFDSVPLKARLSEFLRGALNPSRSKGYLFAAITLLIGAFTSFLWLYFLIFGSICLSLALVSRLNLLKS